LPTFSRLFPYASLIPRMVALVIEKFKSGWHLLYAIYMRKPYPQVKATPKLVLFHSCAFSSGTPPLQLGAHYGSVLNVLALTQNGMEHDWTLVSWGVYIHLHSGSGNRTSHNHEGSGRPMSNTASDSIILSALDQQQAEQCKNDYC
jgi:hypothetical protein